MNTWRKIRADLPADAFIEIDQQEMIHRPEYTASALSRFLEVPSQNSDEMARVFRTHRPQETADGTAAHVISLDSAGWNDIQKATFVRFCKEEMEAFGYSFGPDYMVSSG
jgi:hypothetical protein